MLNIMNLKICMNIKFFLLFLLLILFNCTNDQPPAFIPDIVVGCDGVADSGLIFDECGVCDGDGSSCLCDSSICGCTDTEACNYNSEADLDDESCFYNVNEIIDGCQLPDNHLYVTSEGLVLYNSINDIYGFEFDVDGATVSGASGGDSEIANFFVPEGENQTIVGTSIQGSYISAGCGNLIGLTLRC